jgi:hypothetical protein
VSGLDAPEISPHVHQRATPEAASKKKQHLKKKQHPRRSSIQEEAASKKKQHLRRSSI